MSVDVETGLPVDEKEDDAGAGVVGMPPPGTTLLGGCEEVLEELEQAASSRPHAIAGPAHPRLRRTLHPELLPNGCVDARTCAPFAQWARSVPVADPWHTGAMDALTKQTPGPGLTLTQVP